MKRRVIHVVTRFLAGTLAAALGLGAGLVVGTAPALASVAYETESNGEFSAADALPLGDTVKGSTLLSQGYDRDYYYVDLPADGRVHLSLKFPANLVGRAYDVSVFGADRTDLQAFVVDGVRSDGTWLASQAFYMPAGRMYVAVYGTSDRTAWGKEYELTVTSTPGLVETEPNNVLAAADALPIGATIKGSTLLRQGYDEDYYYVDLPAAGPVQLGLTFPQGGAGIAYRVSVYDTAQKEIAKRDVDAADTSGAALRAQTLILPTGRFYVKIYGTNSWAGWVKEYSLTADLLVSGSTPTISGAAKAGRTLAAVPGAWTSGATLSYQWYRSGRAIAGANARTYKLTKSDVGHRMTVGVTGSMAGYASSTRYSAAKTVAKYGAKVTASKPKVKRAARAMIKVTVVTPATTKPTGRVTVKVAGKTVKVKVTAKSAGRVAVKLPRITKRGSYKAKVTFSPSGSTKISTKSRTVTTTVRVR